MADLAVTAAHLVDDRRARRNVLVLAAAGAVAGAGAPIVFALSSIAGATLLPADTSLATLPVTSFVVGTACGTVPAALLQRRLGRRPGLILGMLVGALGGLVQAGAMALASFALLCVGASLMGFSAAFVQQFRFAAADTASEAFRPKAISWVLAGGIVAGVLGPQTAIHTRELLPSVPFAGAYLGAAALMLGAALVLLGLDIPRLADVARGEAGRPLGVIARQPRFVLAVLCAATTYALMSLVMTAAPLAMVHHGHGQDAALLGIQWHVLAMFGPSFVTGSLIARFGAARLAAVGLALLAACAAVALAGVSVAHFWAALVLLGLGWNFGFIGGTALVVETYRPVERERVQALNEFVVFGAVALASFSSGTLLTVGGWDVVNLVVLPATALCLLALGWLSLQRSKAR
jgi:MFS family permease